MGYEVLDFLEEEIKQLKEQNLYRELFVLETAQMPTSIINGKKVVNLSSNNYLGFTFNEKIKKRAMELTEKYGAGTAAVRTIIGTMNIHQELEARIARFKNTESALVLQSGFATNVAVVQSFLTSEEDFLISDELNHASIIDGGRLCKARRRIYKHKDMKDLENYLLEARNTNSRRIMVVTDGVFSMDGDIAPLPDIVNLCEKYRAILMVDDAHSSGVLGKNGRGTVNHFGLEGRVHIQIGTLSKAIGAMGGYVASTRKVREYLIHKARPFLFSSSHPPAVIGACIAAFEILENEPEIIEKLWENTRFFKKSLQQSGFNTGESETPITPIIVGSSELAMRMSDLLFEEGVFVQGIVYPTVPRGKERLRTIVTAVHTKEELDFALDKLNKIGRKLGILK
ncbi:MAG: glycine C-acetyltransferase [Planctomycetota bacterium]